MKFPIRFKWFYVDIYAYRRSIQFGVTYEWSRDEGFEIVISIFHLHVVVGNMWKTYGGN